MKLLIIGAGRWARKIESVCGRSDALIVTKVVSARAFIERETISTLDLSAYDRIWICTNPKYQLEVLSLLSSYKGVVILEKPYVASAGDFSTLIQMVGETESLIVLSQPWTFSNAWNKFKEYSNENKCLDYSVKRVGNRAHDYINPVADWLPHDLNLILDLMENSINHVQVSSQVWNKTRDRVQFELKVNGDFRFRIESGLNEEECTAIWICDSVRVDFLNSQLADNFKNITPVTESDPIVKFLRGCETLVFPETQKRLQFHKKVMHDLGL